MADELLTPAAFARLKGVSQAAVSLAMKNRIADAVVVRNGKRLLRSEMALRLWEERTPITQRNRKTAPSRAGDDQGPPRLPTDRELRQVIASLPEDEIPPLNESQARREHYQAERQRVAALKERQEVGNIQEMQREAATLGRSLRDSVLAVPDRVAGRVASMNDQHAIRELISGELKTALRALRETLA